MGHLSLNKKEIRRKIYNQNFKMKVINFVISFERNFAIYKDIVKLKQVQC